jgi:hypothetical protein
MGVVAGERRVIIWCPGPKYRTEGSTKRFRISKTKKLKCDAARTILASLSVFQWMDAGLGRDTVTCERRSISADKVLEVRVPTIIVGFTVGVHLPTFEGLVPIRIL